MSTGEGPPEVPDFIRKKHPEMPAVVLAIHQHDASEEVSATCYKCKAVLRVTDLREFGVLEVECGNGCTRYRQRTPPADPSTKPT